MLGFQPVLEPRERKIRMGLDMRFKRRLLIRRQLARAMASVRIGTTLTRLLAAAKRFIDVRRAHPE